MKPVRNYLLSDSSDVRTERKYILCVYFVPPRKKPALAGPGAAAILA